MSLSNPSRTAQVTRCTAETAIDLRLALDGPAGGTIATGDGFLDHVLNAFARHGGLRLELSASGDAAATGVHHLAEDCGIALGEAVRFAVYGAAAVPVGQAASGVLRFGSAMRPMDDALVTVAVDLSGRPGLHVANLVGTTVAGTGFGPAELTAWLGGLASGAMLTLHVLVHAGEDAHHIVEAVAKATGAAIATATSPTAPGQTDRLSTKGSVQLTLKPW
jgi:imidazoleglycerol-phosphate dehydratase